eukprot:CAMPEP_0177215390 /NCGR_PEP_ID=MMETSP0367-20130122/34193_1 /TAXON_ID=447022 ORGANISM="Scrippsiella hangoei-like, Strain SHHI-4" /NCGR_SAMPLE_ID=MMETSP0367 /ASSEMBLY_ACC=CAM_ASM_000362 /LENGTH=49 /DNA_ID= /DNA_START= /DNA_END= /DNA_ORIENTATION=
MAPPCGGGAANVGARREAKPERGVRAEARAPGSTTCAARTSVDTGPAAA